MLKKSLYVVMTLIIILFIYNNYIRPTTALVIPELDDNIDTQGIKYDIGQNYKINASSEVDRTKEEKKEYKNAMAFFNGLRMKGREAIVDKYKNMLFQGNIIGRTKYGLDFNTEALTYDDTTKMFKSTTKIRAQQKLRKLWFESDTFEADSEFNYVNFSQNVKVIYDNMTLTCNKITYERQNKIVKLFDNIEFNAVNVKSEKGDIKKISGESSYGMYDMNSEILTLWGRFKILYEGYTFEGNNLVFEKLTGNINAYDSVRLSKEDLNVYVNRVYYDNSTKKISITDQIRGVKGKYSFAANSGELNVDKEDFHLMGNIVVYEQKGTFNADDINFVKSEDKMYIRNDDINRPIVVSQGVRVMSKNSYFKPNENKLYCDENYTAYYKPEKETVEVKAEGKKFVYNTKEGIGSTANTTIYKGANKIYADLMEFDLDEEKYTFTGNINGLYEGYTFTGQKGIVDQKKEMATATEPFKITRDSDKLEINGKNGVVNNKTKDVEITSGVEIVKGGYRTKSDRLKYNIDTEKGEMTGNLEMTKPEDKLKMTGEKALYQADEETKIVGDILVEKEDTKLKTKEAIYKPQEKTIYLNNEGNIDNAKEELKAKYDKARYDENSKLLYVDNISGVKKQEYKGKKQDVTFKSDNSVYDEISDVFTMKGNVEITVDTTVIKMDEASYYVEKGDIVPKNKVEIRDKNMLITGMKGKVSVKNKTMQAEDVTIVTDEGDKISGDFMEGLLDKKEFNFKGNLKAKLTDGTSFQGELAKMFFVDDKVEDYKISRGEIKNKTSFLYNDISMEAEYLEFDNMKNFVYGKQKPKLKILDETEAVADYIYLDVPKELGKMENNVRITHKNKEFGTLNTNSDKAVLRNKDKMIDLEGHVIVLKNPNKVEAEKGSFNLKTNELSGMGGIKFSYKIEKEKDKKATSGASITTGTSVTTGKTITTGTAVKDEITTGSIIRAVPEVTNKSAIPPDFTEKKVKEKVTESAITTDESIKK